MARFYAGQRFAHCFTFEMTPPASYSFPLQRFWRAGGAAGKGRPLLHLPGPSVKVYELTDHSIVWLVQVWGPTEDRRAVVDKLISEAKRNLDNAGIQGPPVGSVRSTH